MALSGSPAADLRVTVWPQGRAGPAHMSVLHCPSVEAACRKLGAVPGNPFAPTPAGIACTQIYGGPEVALVVGRFRGRPVWARFHRRDGCGIARWNRVAFLFAK